LISGCGPMQLVPIKGPQISEQAAAPLHKMMAQRCKKAWPYGDKDYAELQKLALEDLKYQADQYAKGLGYQGARMVNMKAMRKHYVNVYLFGLYGTKCMAIGGYVQPIGRNFQEQLEDEAFKQAQEDMKRAKEEAAERTKEIRERQDELRKRQEEIRKREDEMRKRREDMLKKQEEILKRQEDMIKRQEERTRTH
ncbi:hypothetical protein, partial [Helicobacter bizzozeronii]|uniref:hypothetical protein n=2 Tax=Helicobacter bizzozeronii TaxID=56877 RepID=UPI001F29E0B6